MPFNTKIKKYQELGGRGLGLGLSLARGLGVIACRPSEGGGGWGRNGMSHATILTGIGSLIPMEGGK